MKRNRDGQVERDDLLSLLFVRWVLSDLVRYMRMVVRILRRRGEDLEESLFVQRTVIQISPEREVSLLAYTEEVVWNAEQFLCFMSQRIYGEEEERVREEFSLMLRGIFLILFLYDLRVQRFVMTNHNLHTTLFYSRPPGRRKANQFMDSVKPLVDLFLSSTSLSLMELSSRSLSLWSQEFMSQSFSEIPYSYSGRVSLSKNIPHNDHQQIWWTQVHRDFDFSLSGEYLGF